MRILCVAPRYGETVLGGAEALVRGFAETSLALGLETHVVTSCAVDAVTWKNELPAGPCQVNGVRVWRYPLQAVRSAERQRQLHYQLMTNQPLEIDEQYEWLNCGPHSPQLYAHIQRYGPRYQAILFAPYVFPLIQYGAAIYPHRSVIWPCLHDEAFARLEPTRLMLNQAWGIIYNSEPERELARRKLGIDHPRSVVAGIGIDDRPGDGARFRQQHNLPGEFLLYSGRLDDVKNVPLLLDYFAAYKRQRPGDLKLALMGRGSIEIPSHPDVVLLGFKQGQAKLDAYAAATLLCQPSVMESFSIVIMEAWLAGAPVLVHGDCPVTRYHCQQSNGGLYFSNEDEFAGCVDWFLDHPRERAQMGRHGRRYVLENYTWEAVARRVLGALRQWLE